MTDSKWRPCTLDFTKGDLFKGNGYFQYWVNIKKILFLKKPCHFLCLTSALDFRQIYILTEYIKLKHPLILSRLSLLIISRDNFLPNLLVTLWGMNYVWYWSYKKWAGTLLFVAPINDILKNSVKIRQDGRVSREIHEMGSFATAILNRVRATELGL